MQPLHTLHTSHALQRAEGPRRGAVSAAVTYVAHVTCVTACRRSSARGRECSRYIRCIRYYAPPVFGRWHFNDKSPLAFLWGGVVASPWGAGLISPSVIALIWPSVVLEQFVHDVVAVAMRLAVYSPTVLFVTPHRQRASSVTSITSVTSVTSVISVTSVTSVTAVTSVTFRRHLLADCRKRRLAT